MDASVSYFLYEVVDCQDEQVQAEFVCRRRVCPLDTSDFILDHKLFDYDGSDFDALHLAFMVDEDMAPLRRRLRQETREVLEVLYDRLLEQWRRILGVLWYSTFPCFDVPGYTSRNARNVRLRTLMECLWKGRPVPCREVFRTVVTDLGMCCAFNMDRAEEMYREESEYAQEVVRLTKQDRNLSYYDGQKLPEWYVKDGEPMSQVGQHRGLTLLLDSHDDVAAIGTNPHDHGGFVAYVAPATEYPFVRHRGFLVRPGHENLVRIVATKVSADDDIRNIDGPDRDCYFEDDVRLKLHKKYSYANCVYECSVDAALRVSDVDCVPWFLVPTENGFSFCDPWRSHTFMRAFHDVSPADDCSRCLPDCDTTRYSASVSSAAFRDCDESNAGLSHLCDFDSGLVPAKYGKDLDRAYGDLPKRHDDWPSAYGVRERNAGNRLFGEPDQGPYRAYERDIAKVRYLFDTVLHFSH